MSASVIQASDPMPASGLGPALRARIEGGSVDVLRAFDAAADGMDPGAADELRQAADALMRALAHIVIRLGSDPA